MRTSGHETRLVGVGAVLGLPGIVATAEREQCFVIELSLRGVLEARAAIDLALATTAATVRLEIAGPVALAPTESARIAIGTSPAQVEQALSIALGWCKRSAHFSLDLERGLALLTPWTTPGDLRQVSDVVRRLGLAPWIGRGLLSRLSIDRASPHFRTASDEDLLQSADDEAEPSWRFKDEVTAAAVLAFTDRGRLEGEDALESLDEALDAIAGIARGKQRRRLAFAPAMGPAAKDRQQVRRIELRGDLTRVDRRVAAPAIAAARNAATLGAEEIVIAGDDPIRAWFLEDLIGLCKNLGFAKVTLELRHGTVDGGLAVRLAAAGLGGAIVHLGDVGNGSARAFAEAGVELDLVLDLADASATLAERVRVASSISRVRRIEVRCDRTVDVENAAREIARAAGVAEEAGVLLRMAPRSELPPCVFEDPAGLSSLFQLTTSKGGKIDGYERLSACSSCGANHACAGAPRELVSVIAPKARPLSIEVARAIAPLAEEEAHYENELESRLFFTDDEGKERERRVLRVNFHCNQACSFCFVDRELSAPDAATIFARIDDAAKHDAELALSGGEPTLNPRLFEYIDHARRIGVRDVEIQTNAVKMADPIYAEALARTGLSRAFVSLHGISAEVSDRVTAAPGTFRRTIRGLQNLVARGVAVRLNFVMCATNHAEFEHYPAFVDREIRSAGPGRVDLVFSFVAPSTDLVPRDARLIPRFRDVAGSLARGYQEALRLKFMISGFESQCGVPPCFLPEEVRESHFAVELPEGEIERAKRGFVKGAGCASCAFERRCFGVRLAYAEMYGADEVIPISIAAT